MISFRSEERFARRPGSIPPVDDELAGLPDEEPADLPVDALA
jgi:hypothetical protein